MCCYVIGFNQKYIACRSSTYKFERHNFRTGRRIAPKFCTHVRIETRLTLSLKKLDPPHPIPIETRSYRRPSVSRQTVVRPVKLAMRMRRFASLNFAFGENVTLSTSTHRHYDECVYRIKQLTRGNNTIGILMTSYRAFQTRQRPVARYVLFTSRAVHVGK